MLADRVILACTILVAVIYLYASTLIPTLAIGDPLGPKAFPRLLGIALLIAAGFLAMELWRGTRDRDAEAKAPPAEPISIRPSEEWPQMMASHSSVAMRLRNVPRLFCAKSSALIASTRIPG